MFSKIDISEKKFHDIKNCYSEIIEDLKSNILYAETIRVKICELENALQINEIVEHLNINNSTGNDIEKIVWIERNAKNYREWLNSIKLFMICRDLIIEYNNVKMPVDINAFVAAFLNDNHEFLQTIFR